MCTLFAQLRRRRDTRARNHESKQIVQNTQKIKPPKKILAKLSYPKHSGIEHFKPKNILRSLSSIDT